jgi:probable rRNA maturation factor
MITIDPPSTSSIPALSKPALTRFLNRARSAVGLEGQVDVLLTSDAELKSLNRAYRGKNKPTDVLSFPTPLEIGLQHAGDLAISIDTAARQAATFDHPLDTEVKILVLHGLLHLAGEDHETDKGQMAAREAELRRKFRLPNGLIERAEHPTRVKRARA